MQGLMALFATLERDSPEADKLITLAHLASDFQDKLRSEPHRQLGVFVYGYLTTTAASDAVKEDIERGLMGKSLSSISKTLMQMGVPIDKLYLGELVFSNSKGRKIDLFLEQQGEARHYVPGNPPGTGRPAQTVNPPKPVRDAGLSVDSKKQLVLEVTAKTIKSGTRTVIPELSFKSNTALSPDALSKAFKAELTLWKPRLEGILKRIGQGNLADKIEFAVRIVGGGKASKEFARQISAEVAASLQAALTFNVTIPGINREIPIELSYSYGSGYKTDISNPTGGNFNTEGQGMIKITLFKFKSW